MFQLLSPFWLVATAGLLVPVLIHLWHKKPPTLVRVGSIRWLQAAASRRVRQLRLQNYWLLIWRCLVLVLLVFFLCQPVWQQQAPVQPVKRIFVSPELLAPTRIKNIQIILDSLTQQGYELHVLTPAFEGISPEKWETIKRGETAIPAAAKTEDYWALARLIPSRFNNPAETIIISTNRLANFKAPRPVLPATYRWLTLPAASKRGWVEEAFNTGADSVRLVVGSSTATQVNFRPVPLALPAPHAPITIAGLPSLRYQAEGKNTYLVSGEKADKILIQQVPLRVSIFYDASRKTDALYVQAALRAISSYTGRPFRISQTTDITAIAPESNWIFWLSDAALPPAIRERAKAGTNILKDTPTQAKLSPASWFRSNRIPGKIAVYRQQIADNAQLAPTWQNNFGEAMLHREQLGQGSVYYFDSRFNPAWNELPQSPLFPEFISTLLFSDRLVLSDPQHDQRIISPAQAIPVFADTKESLVARQSEQQPLQIWFLALAALLFLTERLWSYRRATL